MAVIPNMPAMIYDFDVGPIPVFRALAPTQNELGAFEPSEIDDALLSPVAVHTVVGRELEAVPEADRHKETIRVYTVERLFVTDDGRAADRIAYDGRVYRVTASENYGPQGDVYLALAVLEDGVVPEDLMAGYKTIQIEGVALAERRILNFAGNVEGSDDGDATTITVPFTSLVEPTIASLEARDVSGMPDGAQAWVESLRDWWALSPVSAAAPDGITIVQAADETRFWLRSCVGHPSWAAQASWWIDTVNGNDENDGAAVGTPLETWDELRRRMAGQTVPQGVFQQIELLGGPYGDLVIDWRTNDTPGAFDSAILVVGRRTLVTSATLVGVTPLNNATQTIASVECDTDVSADAHRLIVVETGAASGATAWHVRQGSGGGAFVDVGGFFSQINTEVSPAIGDDVGFYDLTVINSFRAMPGALVGGPFDCSLGNASYEGPADNSASLGRIRFDGDVWVLGRGAQYGSTAGDDASTLGVQFGGALFRSSIIIALGALGLIQSCRVKGHGGVFVQSGSQLGFSLTTTTLGTPGEEPIWDIQGFARIPSGAFLAFDGYGANADCVIVDDGGLFRALGPSASVWGANITDGGTGNVIEVRARSMMTYQTAPVFAPNTDVLVGGVASNLAGLPITTAANFSGIVVDA
jgi:hypothetical protein